MSLLTIDADRLVRDAVDAFIEGQHRPDPADDTMYATRNSRYRIAEGVVEEATDTSLMGAELVGWLIEENGIAYVGMAWQPAARAILVERTQSNHVVVTSRVVTAEVVATAREPVTTLSPRPRLNGAAMPPPGEAPSVIRVSSSSVPPPDPEVSNRRRGGAAADGPKQAGPKQSVIPPSPPIPQLKTNPSVAPPALVSVGPAPIQPSTAGIPALKESSRDLKASDEEITKVDHTELHDADRLRELRELSAEIPVPPAARSKPGPSTKPPARASGRGRGGPAIPPPPPTPLLGSGYPGGDPADLASARPSRQPAPRPASSRGAPPRPPPRIEPPRQAREGKLPPLGPPPSRPRRSK